MIPEAHLYAHGKRAESGTRAMPLGELDQKFVDPKDLSRIVLYLDVEHSQRYKPAAGKTFCNIYAHDYCHLAGAYIPRVWWSAPAIAALAAGLPVVAMYGDTVFEVNANSLHQWLANWGPKFGWRKIESLTELQQLVNGGRVCVITGRRADSKRSGHITCVVPEGIHQATRGAAGEVTLPLQSQAGVKNFCFGCGSGPWWTDAKFGAFGFWAHE